MTSIAISLKPLGIEDYQLGGADYSNNMEGALVIQVLLQNIRSEAFNLFS